MRTVVLSGLKAFKLNFESGTTDLGSGQNLRGVHLDGGYPT
jgi:hypothetical protein